METKLNAERRSDAGKGVARKLRAAGKVPAVLYGQGIEATPLTVDARELQHLLHSGAGSNVLVDVVVEDKLPTGLTFVNASNGGTNTDSDRTIRWIIGALDPGASVFARSSRS